VKYNTITSFGYVIRAAGVRNIHKILITKKLHFEGHSGGYFEGKN
jgi:hypothetical protein